MTPQPERHRRRELARADRILAGVWRLRLPLPWPGVPHVNAWALAAGNGIVLVDTGLGGQGAMAQLDLALGQAGLRVEHVRLLVCTHAHSDHYGLAGPILDAAGCELWLHPNHGHLTEAAAQPERVLERRLEVARQSGVPPQALREYESARRARSPGVDRVVEAQRPLVNGVRVDSDLGAWDVHETPGHAPSHVVLHQPERGLLISGDHLLGRISLYYDYGYTPDPAGEFLQSLDVVERLGARLCLAGHGRPFIEVGAKVAATRAEALERAGRVRAALHDGPRTAFEVVPAVVGELFGPASQVSWGLSEVLCYLRHLEVLGDVRRVEGEPERWSLG